MPFLTKYLDNAKIPYKIVDISQHTELTDAKYKKLNFGTVSLSIDAKRAREKITSLSKDVLALKRFMDNLQQGADFETAVKMLLEEASPALKQALYERYFAPVLAGKTSSANNNTTKRG